MPNQKAYFVNSDVVGAVFHHTKKKTRIIMNHQEPQVPSTCFLHGDEIIFVSVNLFFCIFGQTNRGQTVPPAVPVPERGQAVATWYGMVWPRTTASGAKKRPAFSKKLKNQKWVHKSVAHPENDTTSSRIDMIQDFHWSPSVLAKSIVLVLKIIT